MVLTDCTMAALSTPASSMGRKSARQSSRAALGPYRSFPFQGGERVSPGIGSHDMGMNVNDSCLHGSRCHLSSREGYSAEPAEKNPFLVLLRQGCKRRLRFAHHLFQFPCADG